MIVYELMGHMSSFSYVYPWYGIRRVIQTEKGHESLQ